MTLAEAVTRLMNATDRLIWRKDYLSNQESETADAEWQEARDAFAAVKEIFRKERDGNRI